MKKIDITEQLKGYFTNGLAGLKKVELKKENDYLTKKCFSQSFLQFVDDIEFAKFVIKTYGSEIYVLSSVYGLSPVLTITKNPAVEPSYIVDITCEEPKLNLFNEFSEFKTLDGEKDTKNNPFQLHKGDMAWFKFVNNACKGKQLDGRDYAEALLRKKERDMYDMMILTQHKLNRALSESIKESQDDKIT